MKRAELKQKGNYSDTVFKNIEPEEKEYSLSDGNGLYFRVRPNGNKDWRFRYKSTLGKWLWHNLGGYPATSAKLARQKAREIRERLAHGETIEQIKQQQKRETLKDLIDEWLAIKSKSISPNTYATISQRLNKHIIPAFGKRDYRDITATEWLDFFKDRQEKTGHIEVYQRVCNLVKEIYTYAILIKRGMFYNPINDINKYLSKHTSQSYPHITPNEVGQLIKDIHTYPTEQGRYALLLLAIFYCRPSEILTAEWREIDFDNAVWNVPAHKTKTTRDIIRPIPTQALNILKDLQRIHGDSPYLFPNARDKKRTATIEFLEKALHKIGYKGKHSPHGFRHLASTYLNEYTGKDGFKFDERIIEFSLSHTIHGIKGKYNKAQYLDDRRILAQWYADQLYSKMQELE